MPPKNQGFLSTGHNCRKIARPFSPQKLIAARKRAKLTQQQLADRAGLHQVYIARLETGRQSPGIDVAERLAKTLRCKLTDLLG